MKRLITFLFFFAACSPAQQPAPLKLLQTIPLPGAISGAFDHLAADIAHNRLFVAAEDAHAVAVLDFRTGKLIDTIGGLGRPHAILYRADLNRIYVTDGGAGALKVFSGENYALLQTVPLAKDADSIGYDSAAKYLYIDNGGKDADQPYSLLSIVDTTAGSKVAEMRIDGDTLEAMALDTFRPRAYINNKAKNRIEVIDRWKRARVASWSVTMAKDNVAMALDEPHQRLFVACRSGAIVVFDTNTGKELQAIPGVRGVDDAVYDSASKRIYAAGDGAVTIIRQIDADHYAKLGDVPTAAKARNALLVSGINRYFVAAPGDASRSASILVFEPVGIPETKETPAPATAQVHAPAAENLVLSMLSAHPWLRKMGLHAVPPGYADSVIIANGNASRIGIKSTEGDLAAVKEGKTYCAPREDGAYYNMKLPMTDAQNRRIGILVMEIPFTSASGQEDAIRRAEELRDELARQIPDLQSLFTK